MIESFGGKVTQDVSGRTNVLIVGEKPGDAKVGKAQSSGSCTCMSLHDVRQCLLRGSLELGSNGKAPMTTPATDSCKEVVHEPSDEDETPLNLRKAAAPPVLRELQVQADASTAAVGSAALTTAAPAAGSPAAASPAADLPATDWVSGKKQFVVPVPGPNAPPNSLEGKTFVLTGSFPEVVGDAGLGAFLQFLNPPSPAPAHLHLNPSLLHAQSLARRESRR